MKKILCLLLVLIMAAAFAGCEREAASSTPRPIALTGLPPGASPPDTMKTEDMLRIVNGVMEGGELVFDQEEAEVIDLPATEGDDDLVYRFEKADVEIVLLASRENGCVTGAYFRSLLEDEFVEYDMLVLAGVFLMALEPGEYAAMLDEVTPGEYSEDNGERTSEGEVWRIYYMPGFVSILPGQRNLK